MAESDTLAYDHDVNSQFIIIQSCLKDERHNEIIQNWKNITLLEDNLTFNLGDSFDSFEALTSRLEAHSKQSNVYYWLRDSRTISGARSKTTRTINSALKYFNLNYVCVYGGKPVIPRGEGKRKRMSMRLDCPAHIKLRVNRAGVRLDVVSVCNHHNHPIDPHIYSHLPQVRKLPSDLKPDVYDMLLMGVVKRRILDYVRWRCGKVLTLKDMINIAATIKDLNCPSPQRRKSLLEALKKLELENGKTALQYKTEKAALDMKKARRRLPKKCKVDDIVKVEYTAGCATEELAVVVTEQEPAAEVVDAHDNLTKQSDLDVDSVLEIHYENEENHDSITHSNIMKYFCQTDYGGEKVLVILNEDQEMVTIEPSVLSEQHLIPADDLHVDQSIEFSEEQNIELTQGQGVELTEDQSTELTEDQSIELTENQAIELTENQAIELTEVQGIELTENQRTELCEVQGIELTQGQGVELTEDQSTELTEDQSIELTENQAIELTENQAIELTEVQDIELTENQTIELCEVQGIELTEDQSIELTEEQGVELTEVQDFKMREIQEFKAAPTYISAIAEDQHFKSEDPQVWSNCEVILKETWISSDNLANVDGEIHCDNIMFNNNCNTEQVIGGSSQIVQLVEKCSNCKKIKADLNLEVMRLREEKIQLTKETERLRRAKKKLEQQVKGLKMRL